MNKEEFNQWSKSRKKGFVRFVLFHGVIPLGLGMYFATLLLNASLFSKGITSLFACLVGGVFYGAVLWFYHENRFNRSQVHSVQHDS